MHSTALLPPAELFQRAVAHDFQAGLGLLLEAHRYAREVGKGPWDFSVDAGALRDAGLTASQLRWLLCQGCLRHARETTRPGGRRRTFRFRPATNLKFDAASCFTLTNLGLQLALALHCPERTTTIPEPVPAPLELPAWSDDSLRLAGRLTLQPCWRADLRELRFGGRLVKKFHRRADNQIAILVAFEACGWPARLDNPLRSDFNGDAQERLHDAIKRLNLHQKAPLLRFHGDGTGQGVVWESSPEKRRNGR